MNYLLGLRIRDIREIKGLSLEQLSAFSGISYNKLSLIESGCCNVSLSLLCILADALGVSVSDFTSVLDQSDICLRSDSASYILQMLDLFYANKYLYNKLIVRSGAEQ